MPRLGWPPALAAALAAVLALPARAGDDEPLTLFAAASTKEAVERIAEAFSAETGLAIEVSPGPSSGLARQIQQGAGADVYLSADSPNADFLEKAGYVAERVDLLTNRLVIIVPADSEREIDDVADLAAEDIGRVALAEPKVPVGEYARQAMEEAGVLEAVVAKSVGGIDVRATLQFVARGEADAGFVYATDARGSSKVRVALEVDSALHRPIQYPLVLIERDGLHPSARRFFEYLQSDAAAEEFRAAGFGMAGEGE